MRIQHGSDRVDETRPQWGKWTWRSLALVLLLALPASAAQAAGREVEDDDVTRAIEVKLWIDKGVDGNQVDVETDEGIVTLTGTVDSVLARDRAQAIAENVSGVRAIVNRILVAASGRSDAELTKAVQMALLRDPATDSYEIDVDASGGTVTLSGTVQSWAEKELCVAVAKGVSGVRKVNDQILVQYESERPDSEIRAEIQERLANDVRVDDYRIEVAVDEGKVMLTGAVGSLSEKRQAEADAWVAGVESVDAEGLDIEWWARDEMRRKSLYTPRSDQEIASAVRDAFLYDPRVLSFNPQVYVSGGTVTLSGIVDNLAAKRAAEQDARNVIGVWRVQNHLKVRPETLPTDEELEERVGRVLREDRYVERWGIAVRAGDGVVRLSGKVHNSFQKNRAELLAERVNGVIRVVNDLDYDYKWTWKPDREIREDVKDQLFWSPFVDEGEVTVVVRDGVVTLTGQVDTWGERVAAENNAWEAGAKDVVNKLSVRYTYFGPLAGSPFVQPVGQPGSGLANTPF